MLLRMVSNSISHPLLEGMQSEWYSYFTRVCWFLTKLYLLLLYVPAVVLIDIYLKGLKAYVQANKYMYICTERKRMMKYYSTHKKMSDQC